MTEGGIRAGGRAAEPSGERLLVPYGLMPTVRMLDTGLVEAQRAGEIPVEVFLALGLGAASAGLAAPLDEGDVLAGSIRDLASWPAGGVALDDAVGGHVRGSPLSGGAGRSCRAGTPYPG